MCIRDSFRTHSQDPGEIYPYGFANTSGELDDAVSAMSQVFQDMLKLAEIEKTSQLLAEEIEKTRRRVKMCIRDRPQGHEAAQRLHHHGGGGDAAHLSQHFPPGAEAPQADGELAPEAVHQPEADQRAGDLTDDRGCRGPRNSKVQDEDEDRVQDQVEDGTRALHDHEALSLIHI